MMKKMSRRERKVWAVFNQFLKRKKTFRIYLKISVMFLFLVFNISVTVVHVCVMFLIKFQKKKKMELLEHELLETRASEDKNKKIKMVTQAFMLLGQVMYVHK